MRKLIKYFIARTYKPLLVQYLSVTRNYEYKGIRLSIPTQVFHPGFFFSTKLLLRYVAKYPLKGSSFLELGAGSGLISIFAAKQGARVTATDINPIAIECLQKNSLNNHVQLEIIHADLFNDIAPRSFDFIAINPPYYKKQPLSEADYAWYCGTNNEYFKRLFQGLGSYMHSSSIVLMVLCDGCDIETINIMAQTEGFILDCVHTSQNLVEKNFIYKLNIHHEIAGIQ